MNRPLTYLLLVAAAAFFLTGCSGSSSSRSAYIPPSNTLDGLIPDPVPVGAVRFADSHHYDFHDSAQAPVTLTGVTTVRKEEFSTHVDPVESREWSFGLGRDELVAKIGSNAVVTTEQRLAAYYQQLFAHPNTDAGLRQAIQSFPHWSGVDTDTAQDFTGLRIESALVTSEAATDEDHDGVFETPQTQITINMSLPAITLTPANPLPGCAALLADTAAMNTYATGSGVTYVPPASATWQYRLTLSAHFYVEGHETLDAITDPYLTVAHMNAAARDLGLIVHLFDNIDNVTIPSSDLSVSFGPGDQLMEQTLSVISGKARTDSDVACLRDVDSWEVNAGLIFPEVTKEVIAGAAPTFLMDTYNATLDALDGTAGETGISCLHNASGSVVQVGDHLACDATSGPVLLKSMTARNGTTTYSTISPYQVIEQRAARTQQCAAKSELASNTLLTPDIEARNPDWWNCNNYGLCSARFGRGIRVCLSEVVVHNQVGDYWNIRWWQDWRKASAQSAIRAGGYALRAAAAYYLAGRDKVGPALEAAGFAADMVDKLSNDHKICGWSLKGASAAAGAWKLAHTVPAERANRIKAAGYTLLVDNIVDMFAQAVQVTATGWQDYSDGSHCACGFLFRHPNWCS